MGHEADRRGAASLDQRPAAFAAAAEAGLRHPGGRRPGCCSSWSTLTGMVRPEGWTWRWRGRGCGPRCRGNGWPPRWPPSTNSLRTPTTTADQRAELVKRYATVRPFLTMFGEVVPLGCHRRRPTDPDSGTRPRGPGASAFVGEQVVDELVTGPWRRLGFANQQLPAETIDHRAYALCVLEAACTAGCAAATSTRSARHGGAIPVARLTLNSSATCWASSPPPPPKSTLGISLAQCVVAVLQTTGAATVRKRYRQLRRLCTGLRVGPWPPGCSGPALGRGCLGRVRL